MPLCGGAYAHTDYLDAYVQGATEGTEASVRTVDNIWSSGTYTSVEKGFSPFSGVLCTYVAGSVPFLWGHFMVLVL
jgi:hypothetical protein